VARRFKERGATSKHQYFLIMQITSHNLYKSKCDASSAPLQQETTKIQNYSYIQISNYSRTQM